MKKKSSILSEQFQNLMLESRKSKPIPPSIQINDNSLTCIGTGTSLKSGRVKLVLWAQPHMYFRNRKKLILTLKILINLYLTYSKTYI